LLWLHLPLFTDLLAVSTCTFQLYIYTRPCSSEQRRVHLNVHKTCSALHSTGFSPPDTVSIFLGDMNPRFVHTVTVRGCSTAPPPQRPCPSPFTACGQQLAPQLVTSDNEVRQVLRQEVRRDPLCANDATRLLSRTSTAMYHNFFACNRRR